MSEPTKQRSRTFLPFREEFRGPILSGVKFITTRSKKYGEPGDVLDTPFGPVRLVLVEKMKLGVVRDMLWRGEGVESPSAFERIWNDIHPMRGFREDDERWVHRFEVLPCRDAGNRICDTHDAFFDGANATVCNRALIIQESAAR